VFVFVAVLFEGGDGIDGEGDFEGGFEDYGGGDEVPGADGDDVGGEEVDVVDGVGVFDEIVAAELAEVSGAVADGGGFDLHAGQVAAVFDGDVVGEGVSGGFEDAISVRGGGCHEFEFDPLAAFFESSELLPTLQFHPKIRPNVLVPSRSTQSDLARKHERRDRWAAPF